MISRSILTLQLLLLVLVLCSERQLVQCWSPASSVNQHSPVHRAIHASRSTTSASLSRIVHPSEAATRTTTKSTVALHAASKANDQQSPPFQHTLAILTMPSTSTEKIANEAILNQAVEGTQKLSVVLRANGKNPSLAKLRQYVGEVYSTLWDVAMSKTDQEGGNQAYSSSEPFCDVVVYPQNLPNAAPERWIHHAPDLDSVCSHDSICGWVSTSAQGRGLAYQSQDGQGKGGLEAHVEALNADRAQRQLNPVQAIHVDPWPMGASTMDQQEQEHISFLDDEPPEDSINASSSSFAGALNGSVNGEEDYDDDEGANSLIGGVKVPSGVLFEQVAVGGTFDGMHYGHRKLLTLAISSVNPVSGKLIVGVTVDEMLSRKAYADQIPTLQERMEGAQDFIYRLAPGIKNNFKLFPIADEYGPPGMADEGKDFDALVLSHETLENGVKLNRHRVETLGLPPLELLCTRRTEPHGMSSTALRRRKWESQQRQGQN